MTSFPVQEMRRVFPGATEMWHTCSSPSITHSLRAFESAAYTKLWHTRHVRLLNMTLSFWQYPRLGTCIRSESPNGALVGPCGPTPLLEVVSHSHQRGQLSLAHGLLIHLLQVADGQQLAAAVTELNPAALAAGHKFGDLARSKGTRLHACPNRRPICLVLLTKRVPLPLVILTSLERSLKDCVLEGMAISHVLQSLGVGLHPAHFARLLRLRSRNRNVFVTDLGTKLKAVPSKGRPLKAEEHRPKAVFSSQLTAHGTQRMPLGPKHLAMLKPVDEQPVVRMRKRLALLLRPFGDRRTPRLVDVRGEVIPLPPRRNGPVGLLDEDHPLGHPLLDLDHPVKLFLPVDLDRVLGGLGRPGLGHLHGGLPRCVQEQEVKHLPLSPRATGLPQPCEQGLGTGDKRLQLRRPNAPVRAHLQPPARERRSHLADVGKDANGNRNVVGANHDVPPWNSNWRITSIDLYSMGIGPTE